MFKFKSLDCPFQTLIINVQINVGENRSGNQE